MHHGRWDQEFGFGHELELSRRPPYGDVEWKTGVQEKEPDCRHTVLRLSEFI